jgi:ferredoxin--NADP+ reductase
MALAIPAAARTRVGPVALAPAGRRPVDTEPNATLVDRQDLTPTITRLRFRPDDGMPAFRAGQYFAIGLEVDGRLIQRPYSAASTPAESGDLEFLVRLVAGGALTPTLWRLYPGARIRLGPPKGLFTMAAGDDRQHLLLSTGTGIAPLRSMLGSLLAERRGSPATAGARVPPIIVHGAATMRELAYRRQLQRLASNGRVVYVPAVSRPAHPANRAWRGRTGRLDALVDSIAADNAVDTGSTVAYVCGNPAMIDAVVPRLAMLGLPAEAIRVEQYWTPADRRPAADEGGAD